MEKWDAYDAMGRLTGDVLVRDEPIPEGLYHLVAHIWYRNKKGELLVQRRALSRPLAPGLWACTGGSALKGEDIELALRRESMEEMGIEPDLEHSMHVLTYNTKDAITRVYIVPWEGDAKTLKLQDEEVMDAKWISRDELEALIGKGDIFWQYRYLDLLVRFLKEHPAAEEAAASDFPPV